MPPRPICILQCQSEANCATFHNDLLLTGHFSGLLTAWNIKTRRPLWSVKLFTTSILAVFSMDSEIVAVQTRGTLSFVSAETSSILHSVETNEYSFCRAIKHDSSIYYPSTNHSVCTS